MNSYMIAVDSLFKEDIDLDKVSGFIDDELNQIYNW